MGLDFGAAMSFRTLQHRIDAAVDALAALLRERPIRCAVSGGKDSTVCVVLVVRAAEKLVAEGVQPMPLILSSSDTGVENPEVSRLLRSLHQSVIEHGERVGFEVIARIVRPSLMEAWWPRMLSGRKLPSYVGSQGDCSVDLKIKPQDRLARDLRQSLLTRGLPEPVTVIGSRSEESSQRASNMAEQGVRPDVVVGGVLAPIADWSTDDVMVTLIDRAIAKFPHDYRAILNFYGDSAGGECIVTPEKRLGAAAGGCSSRSGCFTCQKVTEDRSLAALVANERYSHLRPLLQLNRYLGAIRWDLSRRSWVGRLVDPVTGCLKLGPNCFSFEESDRLLRMVLTIDRDERDRALALHKAIERGDVEATTRNRRLAKPQFTNIDEAALLAIDFMRSVDAYGPPHSALSAWHDVYVLGASYPVPEIDPVPRPDSLPEPMYSALALKPGYGLFDPTLAAVADGADLLSDDHFGPRFDIDPAGARDFMQFEFERSLELARSYRSPSAAALRYLRLGIVTVARGQTSALDWHLARGQALYEAGLRHTPMLPVGGLLSAAEHQDRVWFEALACGATTSGQTRPTTIAGWHHLSREIIDRRTPVEPEPSASWLAERVIGLGCALRAGVAAFDGVDVSAALRSAQAGLGRLVDASRRERLLVEAWERANRLLRDSFSPDDDRPTALFPWVILGSSALDELRPAGAGQLDLFTEAA